MFSLFNILLLYITYAFLPIRATGHLIPSEDPYGFPKYAIEYISPPKWDELMNDYNEAGPSSGKIYDLSEDTKCYIPAEEKQLSSQQMGEELETSQILTDTLEEGVSMISQALDDRCVYYNNGFWIYQYCAGEGIIQTHNVSGDPQKLFYLLGRSSPALEDREFRLLYSGNGYYISEFLSGGDICDVTSMERVAEVQYVCGEMNGMPSVHWVREIRTCQYELQVGIPELCGLQLMVRNENRDSATTISCLKNRERSGDHDDKDYVSNLKWIKHRTILDWLTEYDPLFLGFGVYLMKPIDKSLGRSVLIYTDDVNRTTPNNMIPATMYRKIGTGLSRLMHQRAIRGPDGTVVAPGDSFTWVSDVYGLNGGYISTISLNITKEGEAFLVISDDIAFKDETSNFNSFEKSKLPVENVIADQALAAMLMEGIEKITDSKFLEKLAKNPRVADLREEEREYILEHIIDREEFKKVLQVMGLNADDDINFSEVFMKLETLESGLNPSELDDKQNEMDGGGNVNIKGEEDILDTVNQMQDMRAKEEYEGDIKNQEIPETKEDEDTETESYDVRKYASSGKPAESYENEEIEEQIGGTHTEDSALEVEPNVEKPEVDASIVTQNDESISEMSTMTTEDVLHVHDEL